MSALAKFRCGRGQDEINIEELEAPPEFQHRRVETVGHTRLILRPKPEPYLAGPDASVGGHCRQPTENFIRNHLHTSAPSPNERFRSTVHLGIRHYRCNLSESFNIEDPGDGGMHVAGQSFIISVLWPPSPAPQPPTADIHRLVD
jgi:hypothetical protein